MNCLSRFLVFYPIFGLFILKSYEMLLGVVVSAHRSLYLWCTLQNFLPAWQLSSAFVMMFFCHLKLFSFLWLRPYWCQMLPFPYAKLHKYSSLFLVCFFSTGLFCLPMSKYLAVLITGASECVLMPDRARSLGGCSFRCFPSLSSMLLFHVNFNINLKSSF